MEKPDNRIKSDQYFHTQPDNLNCAQAILKGFQNEFNITEQEIEEYRAWGGGRANDGICGALFSAEGLLRKIGKPGITEEFKAIVGEIRCLDIKKAMFPCKDCVLVADGILEKKIK